jgi:hypothetical protein
MKIRNSLVGALLISGTAFGAVYGAAAALPLDGGAIQAATDTSLVCQVNPVTVSSWGVNGSNDAVTGGKATFVQIEGIDDSCAGNRLMGSLVAADGTTIIGYLTTIDPGTGAAKTFQDVVTLVSGTHSYKFQLIGTDGSFGVDAGAISGLKLWIEGGSSSTV